MKVVLQRVTKASVTIDNEVVAAIQSGLLILLGISDTDTEDDIPWLVKKISQLRIFSDEQGKMNASIQDVKGAAIVVSQFTLHAATKKGNRPSFIKAARPDVAIPLYKNFVSQLEQELGKPVQTGRFGADMQVSLINDGPVTIVIDTANK